LGFIEIEFKLFIINRSSVGLSTTGHQYTAILPAPQISPGGHRGRSGGQEVSALRAVDDEARDDMQKGEGKPRDKPSSVRLSMYLCTAALALQEVR